MKIFHHHLPSGLSRSKFFPANRLPCVAAVGVFDGIHYGHQLILKKLKYLAHESSLASLVITFDTDPHVILRKDFSGCLIDNEQKEKLLKALGLDCVWFLKTNAKLLSLEPSEFIRRIFRYFDIVSLVVGEGFCFGRHAKADISYLRVISRKYRFQLIVVKKIKKEGHTVSSSLIRKLIKKGDVEGISKFLGRDYSLKGRVVKGLGLGRKLGFPTANLKTRNYVIPAFGVYAGRVLLGNRKYLAAINIGRRPGVNSEAAVEAHILGFKKNILNKEMQISFYKKIREEKKFSSHKELKAAISRDTKYIAKLSFPPSSF